MKANVFASEEMFKGMINPVQMGVDTKGRIWAAVWPTYPKWEPIRNPSHKKMQDAFGDSPGRKPGRQSRQNDHLCPSAQSYGFEFWNGGVIVASCPDLIISRTPTGMTWLM